VNDVYEENCLLNYAHTADGIIDNNAWFWTDGSNSTKLTEFHPSKITF